jgi:hypothetical protein
MNRKILLLLLTTTITTLSFAQGFHIGVKGGANVFKVDAKSFDEEFRHGYNLGAFAEINFNKKWGIQPEVLWNQTNTKTSSDFNDIYPHGVADVKDVKLNYLSIPILLTYRPFKALSLQAGPQVGILMDQGRSLLENGGDAFKKGDFAMVGGAQLNIAAFKIGARYQVGLNNINDIDNQDKWKNQGFQAYVGFRIF